MSVNFHRLKNHILNDPLCDWFDKISEISSVFVPSDYPAFYTDLQVQKEAYISNFVDNFRYTHSHLFYENLTKEQTHGFLKENKECILYNCELYHEPTKLLVRPTLLFSRDAFQSIFTEVSEEFPPYIAVDVLYKILHISSDFSDLLNQGSLYYHKCKMALTSQILAVYHGPLENGYFFGKEYRHKGTTLRKRSTIGKFALTEDYLKTVTKALKWVHKLDRYYDEWLILPKPTVSELYPNLNVKSLRWQTQKVLLGEQIKEITLVWNISFKKRCILHDKGITEWSDPLLLSQMYAHPINESQRHLVQDKIIKINSQESLSITPSKIQSEDFKEIIRDQSDSIILDIESVHDRRETDSYFADNPDTSETSEQAKICIIGTILNHGTYVFKDFTIRCLTLSEEETIVKYWVNYLKKRFKDKVIKVYHWGHAEETYLTYMTETYPHIAFPKFQMINLLTYFREEPIAIKGCFGYGLKEIVKQLYNLKLIDTTWSEDLTGLDAMNKILEVSKIAEIRNIPIKRFAEIKKIITYNYYDCRVIVDLLRMLEGMV